MFIRSGKLRGESNLPYYTIWSSNTGITWLYLYYDNEDPQLSASILWWESWLYLTKFILLAKAATFNSFTSYLNVKVCQCVRTLTSARVRKCGSLGVRDHVILWAVKITGAIERDCAPFFYKPSLKYCHINFNTISSYTAQWREEGCCSRPYLPEEEPKWPLHCQEHELLQNAVWRGGISHRPRGAAVRGWKPERSRSFSFSGLTVKDIPLSLFFLNASVFSRASSWRAWRSTPAGTSAPAPETWSWPSRSTLKYTASA